MPEKKQETFTVTDRRLFTSDGEARSDVEKEPVSELTSAPPPVSPPAPPVPPAAPVDLSINGAGVDPAMPPTPTAQEQQEQADAYRKSAKELDTRVELSGHSAKEMERPSSASWRRST